MTSPTTKKRSRLNKARVLLGITGSVAATKAPDLIRRLRDAGAEVTPVLTSAATRFITPLSIEIAAGRKSYSGMFDDPLAHIELAAGAGLFIIAPATANTTAKLACGIADDLLSACFLAYRGPAIIAPAMNWRMYEAPAFRDNLAKLISRGVVEVAPSEGLLACGEEGRGRLAPVERIVEAAEAALAQKDLAGASIVITAGPTREKIDTARFISNRSTGKMGYALARAALRRGAKVTLISGPATVEPPHGVEMRRVLTASEMRDAVHAALPGSDVLIMAAAVADLRPVSPSDRKLAKAEVDSIAIEKTTDILAEVGAMDNRPYLVGFAAESAGDEARARQKLARKGADFMVLNDIDDPMAGFEAETNRITIVDSDGSAAHPHMSKLEAAGIILDRVASALKTRANKRQPGPASRKA